MPREGPTPTPERRASHIFGAGLPGRHAGAEGLTVGGAVVTAALVVAPRLYAVARRARQIPTHRMPGVHIARWFERRVLQGSLGIVSVDGFTQSGSRGRRGAHRR
jgi:hypothetical protein